MAPDLLSLFAEPSVAFLFYMSVIALSCAALFMALGQRMRSRAEKAAARFAQAAFGVTLAWLALMIGAVAVLLSGQPADAILPPLDRAVSAAVVLLVGWAFLTADRRPVVEPAFGARRNEPIQLGLLLITGLAVLAGLVIVGGYAYTASQWYTSYTAGAAFDASEYGRVWAIGITGLAAVIALLLLLNIRRVLDAPLKVLFFVLIGLGYGYLTFTILNDQLRATETGALRLAFLAAMPLLPVIVYRLVIDRLTESIQSSAQEATVSALNTISTNLIDTTVERESVTLLKALGIMLEREKPDELPRQIAIAVAQVLKADVTALLVLDDAEYADVIAAYDFVQQRSIAAMAIKLDEQPTLTQSMQDRLQKTLNADQHLNELVDLYTRLDIQKIGPVYLQPLTREGDLNGMLIVALPYTQRDLRESERRLLESVAPMASRMLALSRAAQRARIEAQTRPLQSFASESEEAEANMSAARAEMQASLETARGQIRDLGELVRTLQIELDFERSRLAELVADDPDGLSVTQRLERMAVERNQLESERERLMTALQEAQTQLASASGDDSGLYDTMIRALQQERDELQAQKESLEKQLTEVRATGGNTAPAVLRDMLSRLSEEKTRFSAERDQLRNQLNEVEAQLAALGIEGGPAGLSSLLLNLTEERSRYKAMADRAVQDRDMLLAEIQRFRDRIASEAERDSKISALENEVRRLAQDREVLMRRRDALQQERETTNNQRTEWEALRTRLVADLAAAQEDLQAAIFEQNRIMAERNKLAEERATLLSERDKLLAGRTALQTERDQLLARMEGNREALQKLGAEGVGQMKVMIDELTEERSDLEHQLLKARSQMQKLQERLDESNRKLSAMSDAPRGVRLERETVEVMLSVAQELRNPLNSIVVYTDMLLGESVGLLGELQRQFLQRVKANRDRLAELVDDFVRVVAIDTGQLRLKMEQVDMAEVIDDAITATRTQFREKGITLNLSLPETLPATRGDRGALQQVMVELLSNAYRASPTDGEVGVRAQYVDAYKLPARNGKADQTVPVIQVVVRDNGGGVPPEEQSRVFTRFYRADSPLVPGLGDTGVGLSIARALVESHGGHIWLECEAGKSSTFSFVLPIGGRPGEKAETAEKRSEKKAENVAS